ncbi:MAG TPA: CocE/NonD family hydrolase, partial [Chlamydiales bacterium]|nr:CocE/NonD family hydrolase [Chlamydiales bacterium]
MLQLVLSLLLPILLFASAEHSFIEHPEAPHHKIEFFMQKPDGAGPFPILFLVHGYQPLSNRGGKEFVDLNYLSKFVNEGIVAVAISVPGFGASVGSRDCSGPASQKAIGAVIHHFVKSSFIDPQRMGIYGIS